MSLVTALCNCAMPQESDSDSSNDSSQVQFVLTILFSPLILTTCMKTLENPLTFRERWNSIAIFNLLAAEMSAFLSSSTAGVKASSSTSSSAPVAKAGRGK